LEQLNLMAEDFTQMTNNLLEKTEWEPIAQDRCDQCGAMAYVQTIGVTGDLLFCAHHYQLILDNDKARNAMNQFAYQISDMRFRLGE